MAGPVNCTAGSQVLTDVAEGVVAPLTPGTTLMNNHLEIQWAHMAWSCCFYYFLFYFSAFVRRCHCCTVFVKLRMWQSSRVGRECKTL